MKFLVLTVAICFSTLLADNDGPINITSSGTVPFCVSFNSDGNGQDAAADATTSGGDFATVTDEDYDRQTESSVTNYFDIQNIIDIVDFDANHLVEVKLTKGGWTLPSDYAGAKTVGGTETTEFLVLVNVTNAGYPSNSSEGLTTSSTFGSDYTGLGDTATEIISGGAASHGVEDASFDIDARVLFDWLTDIPGTYTVELTLSVVEGS